VSDKPDHFQTDLSVGEILRRTRIHYDQSLPDIERALHIRAALLEALEEGDYDRLPGRVYVIGFIRSYSEYLGLDGEKMVALFKKQAGVKAAPPTPSRTFEASAASDTKMPQPWQIGVSALGVLAILIFWFSMQSEDRSLVTDVPAVSARAGNPAKSGQQSSEPAPVQQAMETESDIPQPAPVQNAHDDVGAEIETAIATNVETTAGISATAPAAGAEDEATPSPDEEEVATPSTTAAVAQKQGGIILNIRKNSWVEIRGKDGQSIVSRVLNAGDRYYVPDRPDLTISLGNAGGVELEVDGKKLKPLGLEGDVKRNIPLDAASLKSKYGQ
jgi:cytoskeleton protein RodZ